MATHTFDRWYREQLLEDARKPPRDIDESQFEPKRKREASSLYEIVRFEGEEDQYEHYESERERALRFFDDYDIYKENNLETLERAQLFTVLDRYFQGQVADGTSVREAKMQSAIQEFFSNPENAGFFDKTK
jgi:hypothetical protein